MPSSEYSQSPGAWAERHFGGSELSDARRVDRAVTIAEAMAASPGVGLPQMFARQYDLKAAYRFFGHEEATPDRLQAGHRERVLLEMERPGKYLLLEDTSEIICVNHGGQQIAGLGPVGGSKEKKIGFHLHTTLSVRWPAEAQVSPPRRPIVELIGLADQQYYIRQPRPADAKHVGRRVYRADNLESALWEKSSQRIGVAPASKEVIWIKVSDRGSDIYDHIGQCQQQGHRFVIRANLDRVLVTASGKKDGKLFGEVRNSASLGQLELKLRSRPGHPARRARLEVSTRPVMLRSPQVAGHSPGTRPAIVCTAVRVWEPEPPAGVEALEWILLTDLLVENFESTCEVAQMYSTRWVVEEFHKALKTGMGVERLQLTKAQDWFAATAMMSVVALRLVDMREHVRQNPEAAAESAGLSQLELEVLRARIGKRLQTVGEVALAIARLGGHLNRKSDGPPGWITLWRGWFVLQTLVEGVLLARKLTHFG
jgi:hypothetical protein